MKAPDKKPHPIRKENDRQLRTSQHTAGLNVAVTQSCALQSEIGLPAVRAIWSVIETAANETAEADRRRKR